MIDAIRITQGGHVINQVAHELFSTPIQDVW